MPMSHAYKNTQKRRMSSEMDEMEYDVVWHTSCIQIDEARLAKKHLYILSNT